MSAALPLEQRLRSITIEPAASTWADLVKRSWNGRPTKQQAEFRAQLGLPTDRPVIMSGHQAEFWHPGIFAKYVATGAAARAIGGAPAWVMVDQDTNTPGNVRYPVHDDGGALRARAWDALPRAGALAETNVPLCRVPAEGPADAPAAGPESRPALDAISTALRTHASASSVAEQVTLALDDILGQVARTIPTILASRLASTALFVELLDRMRRDPLACVRAYNAAARAHPGAGMKLLLEGEDAELPLWVMPGLTTDPKPRRRATVRALADAAPGSLAPRALFMTGLLRYAGCDLFVHGLGGGVYDPITEAWFRSWLGAELAPAAVVTATLTLPLEADVLPPEAIDWAVWRAHHARHDPLALGDRSAAARKAALLSRIRAAKKAGEDPAPAFRELHEMLDGLRADHAPALEHLGAEAARVRARRPEAAVLHDRTWAVPFYPHIDLESFRSIIEAAFSSSGAEG